MEKKHLLYLANGKCARYFCGEKPDGTFLFCASKSLAMMLPDYAREVWTQIISDRTGHKPLAEPVLVLRESTKPKHLTVRSERPAWRVF
jgi:hypothetical protein